MTTNPLIIAEGVAAVLFTAAWLFTVYRALR